MKRFHAENLMKRQGSGGVTWAEWGDQWQSRHCQREGCCYRDIVYKCIVYLCLWQWTVVTQGVTIGPIRHTSSPLSHEAYTSFVNDADEQCVIRVLHCLIIIPVQMIIRSRRYLTRWTFGDNHASADDHLVTTNPLQMIIGWQRFLCRWSFGDDDAYADDYSVRMMPLQMIIWWRWCHCR